MTHPASGAGATAACNAARRAMLAGDAARDGHTEACPRCAAFSRRLHDVDAALAASARAPGGLSAGLRSRIVAVTRMPVRSHGRGLVLDWSLRAAAAAAVLAAAAWVAPATVLAADTDPWTTPEIPEFGPALVGDALSVRLAALPALAADPGVPQTPESLPLVLGAAALVAGGLGITLARRRP